MHTKFFSTLEGSQRAAAEKALAAGVPIFTIIAWLFAHGADFKNIIDQLIAIWSKHPVTP